MILLRLFYEYFKVGLFSVGGGLATVPFLAELSDKTGWFTKVQLADMLAISESTPGPIGVNMASYVGFTAAGIPGVIFATFGLVAPSVIVIIIVISIISKFKDSEIVKSVYYGLRPASLALISAAGIEVVKIALVNFSTFKTDFLGSFNIKSILLAVVVYFAMKKIKIHPVFFILASAIVGIVFNYA